MTWRNVAIFAGVALAVWWLFHGSDSDAVTAGTTAPVLVPDGATTSITGEGRTTVYSLSRRAALYPVTESGAANRNSNI